MRTPSVPPAMVARIASLGMTEAELDAIIQALRNLAANPKFGYRIPFVAQPGKELRRFDVGRFGLIYEFDDKTLGLVQVID